MKKLVLGFLLLSGVSGSVFAVGGEAKLADVDIELNQDAYQRGAKVVLNLCSMCHNLKYIKYRHLVDIGYTQEDVDGLRGDNSLDDSITAHLSADQARRVFGQAPPDLSVMAKARKGGPRYIYTLLTSYHENSDGSIDNTLFPGIGMPDVLDLSIEIDETRRQWQEQKARDVSSFLTWAADPQADTRRAVGLWVIVYFAVLTLLLWLWKRRVWSDLK